MCVSLSAVTARLFVQISRVPIEVLSRRLGHSSIGITMDRYLVVYRERDRAAADAFDRTRLGCLLDAC
jgi:integrase